jgi:hypothetical protein
MRFITILTLMGFAATASAQTSQSPPPGTTLQFSGGAASASSETSATLGASFGWELTPRAEIEGAGTWLVPKDGREGFAADMRLLVNVLKPSRLVPYVGAGMGLYHASFDIGTATVPPFYQRRDDATPGSLVSYTDPAAVFVGGANFYIGRHLSLRPEVALRMAFDHGATYNIGSFTCAFVYHFEDHGNE